MKLSEPLTIQGMTMKNRLVMAPMEVGVGLRSARARAYYRERAQGEVGTIICAAVAADFFASDEAWGKTGGLASFIDGVSLLTQEVHQAGAKIGIQIWYGNRYPAYMGLRQSGERVAPSPRAGKTERWEEVGLMREFTPAEITHIVESFAKGAAGVREAGFDFVELHGAHGYLLNQFFSPRFNQRKDNYGGSLENRMHFGQECVAAVRKAVGAHYPIFYRLGAWEQEPGGVVLEESTVFAWSLVEAGVDCVDVSVSFTPGTPSKSAPLKKAPMGTFAWVAAEIKKAVSVPVIAVGRINSHKVAEEILNEGKADLVAQGRQLVANPLWMAKVATGRFREIVACNSCNKECFGQQSGEAFGCNLNPRAGREYELPLAEATPPTAS